MESLWAPWRMEYIQGIKSDECIFCTLPPQNDDQKNKILYRGTTCFIIINTFPYSNGHLMVTPYRHLSCLTKVTPEELLESSKLIQKTVAILREAYNPDGFNVGYNIGKSAGAGFDEHIHAHIVPRWAGDTNFMPVLSETKVHPEHLEATFTRLQPHFQKLSL